MSGPAKVMQYVPERIIAKTKRRQRHGSSVVRASFKRSRVTGSNHRERHVISSSHAAAEGGRRNPSTAISQLYSKNMDYSDHFHRIRPIQSEQCVWKRGYWLNFWRTAIQSITIPFLRIKHSAECLWPEIWPRLVPEAWHCHLVEHIGNKAEVSVEIHWGTENQNESIGSSPQPEPNE